jgi:putative ABC transport system permease protein
MVRLFRFLIRLTASGLRREFGTDMEETFARRWNDARASGWVACLRLFAREFVGVIALLFVTRSGGGDMENVTAPTRAKSSRRRLEDLASDLRFAGRLFRRQPAFTAVTLTVLALGIGAATAMFSIVNSVLLRPLPFRDADRLVMLENRWLPRFPRFEATPRDFVTWKEESHSYTEIAAFRPGSFNLTDGDIPERVPGMRVSANLTQLLGVAPILGRGFTAEEDAPGKNLVVLLSHSLWLRRFAADPSVVGRDVRMNGLTFTVVGIMPPGFQFPTDAEIYVPLGLTPQDLQSGDHVLWAAGRLKPGVTPRQALAELDLLMTRLNPTTWRGRVVPFDDYYVGDVRLALRALFGGAGCLLLIACTNVANLLLARGAARGQEMAVRTSLGATRGRVVQQLLTESALLSLVGGGLGLATAFGLVTLVRTWPWPGIYRLEESALDARALLFTIALSIGTSVLFGLSPARRLSRPILNQGLRGGGRAAGSRDRTRIRNTLVIAELALAVVLLVGAGLFLRSLTQLFDVPLGFNPHNVLAVTINLSPTAYHQPVQQVAFSESLLNRLSDLPGVQGAAISTAVPLAGVTDVGVTFDGRSPGSPLFATNANYFAVTPSYLRVMQIPLIRGRVFTPEDTATSPPVVLINETMAHRSFPDEDPIGRRLDVTGHTYTRQIVGIVGDVKQESVKTPTAPQVYEPFAQQPRTAFRVVLRATGNSLAFEDTVRRAVRTLDRAQPISQARLMEDAIGRSLARDRFSVVVLGAFACVALVLASVGLYGVVAYVVTQRTNEIGIRMALGAEPGGIQRLVMFQSLRVVSIGLGLGLAGAIIVSPVLGGLLYDVKPRDPTTLGGVTVLLIVVALAAAFMPARRAAAVDPVLALRSE